MSDLAVQRLSVETASMTPSLALRDFMGITKRNLLRIIRTPQLLVMSIVQPAIILLLFRYVLGGAIHVPGINYVNYVVPGIFLEAVLIGGMTTSLALAQDLQAGMIDRFRSLPMARSAFLAGRTLADLCRSVLALFFIIGLGLLVGFRFENNLGACLAGIGMITLFGWAFIWVYAAVGLVVKDPQTAQTSRHPSDVHPLLRQLRRSARGHDARLAPELRPKPAGQRRHQLGAGTFRGRAAFPGTVAGDRLVPGHLRGLLLCLIEPLPQGGGVGRQNGRADSKPN